MEIALSTPSEIAQVPPQRLAELVDSYVFSQDVKPSSRDLYRRTLKQYFSWVNRKGYQLSTIARPQVLEYKDELITSGKSILTVGSYITSVRGFYEWAEANKYYPNVAKKIKTPRRVQRYRKRPLSPEQASDLLNYLQGVSLRDYAIINLLLRTGLRTVELVRANLEDITTKTFPGHPPERVLLVQGKGKDEKDSWVKLKDKAYQPLAEYLSTRPGASEKEPLFISTSNNSKGERLTTRTVSRIAKEGLKAIGLEERAYTAHSLRHTGATCILRATGNLEEARLFCRHSNPATTLIYVSTIDEERRLKHSGEDTIDTLY